MADVQPGILVLVPPLARYLFFAMVPGADARPCLRALGDAADGDGTVVGLGESLVLALGRKIDGLGTFPRYAGAGFEVPSTPAALWCWLRGEDRGELVHRARAIERIVSPAFRPGQVIDAFRYGAGLDLTGYEDGTENPKGAAAVAAAVVSGRGPGLDGASFAAVQQWVHDLDRFDSLSPDDQDNTIGRRRSDNRELADAPPSAHVKRTAQESFDPAAFVLRRSMPWAGERRAGLVFVAFGKSFDAFEAQLRRMVGAEDGIADALFRFTRPTSGSYFWCPPLKNGRLDLSAVGL
ncbi:MAG: Dyp-type peroxidase [Betaproteobacteria bacterium]|nr:Dyp-type peroxidase [Betaproteobacteria bacterium]